jgi:hypothetical protein
MDGPTTITAGASLRSTRYISASTARISVKYFRNMDDLRRSSAKVTL